MTTMLVAPCGINCGVCMAYQRGKNTCPGCRGNDAGKPPTRVRCAIKLCRERAEKPFCFSCAGFPCARLRTMDKRYREKYRISLIGNLEAIRDHGIRKFIVAEKTKWICPDCGASLCVHRLLCPACGRSRAV